MPQIQNSNGSYSSNLTLLPNLEYPWSFICLLLNQNESVLLEPSIDKPINISIEKWSNVWRDVRSRLLLEMCLENILRFLGVCYFQVIGELDIEIRKLIVRNNRIQLFTQIRNIDFLSGTVESKLFLDHIIRTIIEQLLNLLKIIQSNSYSQSIQVLLQS